MISAKVWTGIMWAIQRIVVKEKRSDVNPFPVSCTRPGVEVKVLLPRALLFVFLKKSLSLPWRRELFIFHPLFCNILLYYMYSIAASIRKWHVFWSRDCDSWRWKIFGFYRICDCKWCCSYLLGFWENHDSDFRISYFQFSILSGICCGKLFLIARGSSIVVAVFVWITCSSPAVFSPSPP